MYEPSKQEFLALARQGNTIPVYRTLLADHLTPVLAFQKLLSEGEQGFLLESVVGLERVARYTFLGVPRFAGGAVGYVGYDIIRHYERLPNCPKDDRGLPDMVFGFYDTMVIFDHVLKTVQVVSNAHLDEVAGADAAYQEATSRIDAVVDRLRRPAPLKVEDMVRNEPVTMPYAPNFKREEFCRAVEACKEPPAVPPGAGRAAGRPSY